MARGRGYADRYIGIERACRACGEVLNIVNFQIHKKRRGKLLYDRCPACRGKGEKPVTASARSQAISAKGREEVLDAARRLAQRGKPERP
jgi:hypothetical protein